MRQSKDNEIVEPCQNARIGNQSEEGGGGGKRLFQSADGRMKRTHKHGATKGTINYSTEPIQRQKTSPVTSETEQLYNSEKSPADISEDECTADTSELAPVCVPNLSVLLNATDVSENSSMLDASREKTLGNKSPVTMKSSNSVRPNLALFSYASRKMNSDAERLDNDNDRNATDKVEVGIDFESKEALPGCSTPCSKGLVREKTVPLCSPLSPIKPSAVHIAESKDNDEEAKRNTITSSKRRGKNATPCSNTRSISVSGNTLSKLKSFSFKDSSISSSAAASKIMFDSETNSNKVNDSVPQTVTCREDSNTLITDAVTVSPYIGNDNDFKKIENGSDHDIRLRVTSLTPVSSVSSQKRKSTWDLEVETQKKCLRSAGDSARFDAQQKSRLLDLCKERSDAMTTGMSVLSQQSQHSTSVSKASPWQRTPSLSGRASLVGSDKSQVLMLSNIFASNTDDIDDLDLDI